MGADIGFFFILGHAVRAETRISGKCGRSPSDKDRPRPPRRSILASVWEKRMSFHENMA
jgi:hypothetical protein